MAKWPFRQARNYHPGRLRPLRMFVLHDMEYAESDHTAEDVSSYFANQLPSQVTGSSAHVCADLNSVVQCVHLADTAWAAPNANADGFHLETPGYARFTERDWLADDAMLNIASCVAAEFVVLMRYFRHDFPLERLTDAQIRDGQTMGFTDHADITRAFATPGGHTDPGPNFPWNVFLAKVGWWVPHITSIDFT